LGDVPGGVPEQTDSLFRLIDPAARRIWRDAAAATAVSSFVKELAERHYGRGVTCILNGIDLRDAPPAPASTHGGHLVFVGRFNPQKNPIFLLDALARLPRIPWKLTMIGDGPLMGQVRDQIARHHLEDRVTTTGWLDASEVQRILGRADILCLPSTSEGLPVAAIEALKYGLAIVASDIPGIRDVVDDGKNGYRVPLNELDAFKQRIQRLLEEAPKLLTMKRISREKAQIFDLTRIADDYERILTAAVAKAPRDS
jgi:glycosyltransferase involved in cell wall biosynthesis